MRSFCCLLLILSMSDITVVGEDLQFNRDIRPLLSDRCFACHGPDAEHREASLRLDIESGAKESVIVAGNVEASELIARITSDDSDLRMPPSDSGKRLEPSEVDLLKRWIQSGATYQAHWAYVAPRSFATPSVDDHDWGRNWIDHFILKRLREEGLEPSVDADPVTLLRRLSFDLTGLPPKPKEVDAFVAEYGERAIEVAIDRRLASDRFGERMAMYWLDLVRFADTVGYHGDQDQRISPYRDYVIDAFNNNLPFDQFTREQLAGDLLPEPTIDQKIATGYNRLLQTSHEGGVQPKEYLAIYAADRVRNLSAVWMGATMGCCQCHDHKYDPFTSNDFYSMAAFFADIDEAGHFSSGSNSLPTNRPPEIAVLTRRERERIAALERRIASIRETETNSDELERLTTRVEQIRRNARKTMITVAIEPREMRVLPRGDWLDESGELVSPAIPKFLGNIESTSERPDRLDLANWLTDAKGGSGSLTARVFANRFWYLLMGSGISRDLDDFGGQGEAPLHPELLDRLALEFIRSGWNVKQMIKTIAMSRTYRQSSFATARLRERDPENRLYARQSRYRLPAELIRDNALAISDLLVLDYGGASAKPYQPFGYYQHLNFPKRFYAPHDDKRQWRRGVYMHWQRQYLHPMLKAFDAPTREECTAQRSRSNTPTAALVLLNDPTFVEAARVFAERILVEGGSTDDERLDFAFRNAVARKPDDEERRLLMRLLVAPAAPANAADLFEVGLAPREAGLDAGEVLAWTSVARAILNLNETMTRN